MNFRRPLLLSSAIAAATTLLCGYAYVGTTIDWQYFGTPAAGQTLPYDSNGGPTYQEFARTMPASLPKLPATLQTKVNYTLPEGKDIRKNNQGLLPDTDDKTNVRFKEDADVWVTFVSEGAGYRNSVGYFTYDPLNPPRSPADVKEKIIFTNASMTSPLDPAEPTGKQNTVNLGSFKAGQALGFMIVADGFSSTGRLVGGKRVPGVKDNADKKWVFYTLRGLNPEAASSQNLNVHTVMLKDVSDSSEGYQRLVIGFEDINRESGGDHDFNDVVLAVHVTPRKAIANIDTLPTLVRAADADTDGDGVKDALDEFPTDKTKAFTRYYPTRDTFGTLAYEDLWPKRGDYDMNDLVVRYRSKEVMDASRKVSSIEVEYRVDARGADIESGFAVQLPNVSASNIASASLVNADGKTVALSSEAGQSLATFVLFQSAQTVLPGTSKACPFANTQAECPSVPTKTLKLTVNLKSPMADTDFSSPYNPFIFRTNERGHEVHLPGKAPTQLADTKLFGTVHDRTVVGKQTYVDANGRPWALDLPTEWKYPNETIDLTVPYPAMLDWAKSGGKSSTNWFVSAGVPKWLWVKR